MKFLILTLLATAILNTSTAVGANYIDTAFVQNSGGQIRPQEGTRGDCFSKDCTISNSQSTSGLSGSPEDYILLDYKRSKYPDAFAIQFYPTWAKNILRTNTSWSSNDVDTRIIGPKRTIFDFFKNTTSYGKALSTTIKCENRPVLILEFFSGELTANGDMKRVRKVFSIHEDFYQNRVYPMTAERCSQKLIPMMDFFLNPLFKLNTKTDVASIYIWTR